MTGVVFFRLKILEKFFLIINANTVGASQIFLCQKVHKGFCKGHKEL